jgi:hypothetical protein
MLRIVKLGLAASLTALLIALASEWAVIAGAFATYRDLPRATATYSRS